MRSHFSQLLKCLTLNSGGIGGPQKVNKIRIRNEKCIHFSQVRYLMLGYLSPAKVDVIISAFNYGQVSQLALRYFIPFILSKKQVVFSFLRHMSKVIPK